MKKASRYKIIIQFNGTNYFGWQIQNQNVPTIQLEVNRALKNIFKEQIKTVGSGRTDAGVHAWEYHVAFDAPFDIAHESLVRALNSHLPEDIRVLESEFVSDNFRPTNDAKSKEYQYLFTTESIARPFSRLLMEYVKYDLDLKLMEEACALFVGKHDFKNFHCLGSDPQSTVREIYKCQIFKERAVNELNLPGFYRFHIEGNGFLKQMVRLIVGAVWDVGKGRLHLTDIEDALLAKSFKHIAPVAPPGGLYKYKVHY